MEMLGLFESLGGYHLFVFVVAIGMLIINTVEVGRNDAANLVNAVFGSRIMRRKKAVLLAGIGVVIGATFSSGVIETVRKDIFDRSQLTADAAITVFMSVYIVNTVLLYAYSAFGMPVSTTASLVFALIGAAFATNGFEIVDWGVSGKVVFAIVASVFAAGTAGFFVQRLMRAAIRDRTTHLPTLMLHGWWVAGLLLTGLCYFLLMKGMKQMAFVDTFNEQVVGTIGPTTVLFLLWTAFSAATYGLLRILKERLAPWLFPGLAVIGMIAMAIAFGQNDLANCASPGLAIIDIVLSDSPSGSGAEEIKVEWWKLFACGLLLFAGMTTTGAQRVTRAEVNMGSMGDRVRLYAPGWCIAAARLFLRKRGELPALAPAPTVTERGKTVHYDTLRASVITAVSASVIATASSLKLPVSTTYVAFAAVVATGMADRIFERGDAALKLGRAIWVVFSWFAAAFLSALTAGLVCRVILHLGTTGIVLGIVMNLVVRELARRRSNAQENRLQREAEERRRQAGTDEAEVPDDDELM